VQQGTVYRTGRVVILGGSSGIALAVAELAASQGRGGRIALYVVAP
jgi:hypothetical protein